MFLFSEGRFVTVLILRLPKRRPTGIRTQSDLLGKCDGYIGWSKSERIAKFQSRIGKSMSPDTWGGVFRDTRIGIVRPQQRIAVAITGRLTALCGYPRFTFTDYLLLRLPLCIHDFTRRLRGAHVLPNHCIHYLWPTEETRFR